MMLRDNGQEAMGNIRGYIGELRETHGEKGGNKIYRSPQEGL
jgi:hypothetical protein